MQSCGWDWGGPTHSNRTGEKTLRPDQPLFLAGWGTEREGSELVLETEREREGPVRDYPVFKVDLLNKKTIRQKQIFAIEHISPGGRSGLKSGKLETKNHGRKQRKENPHLDLFWSRVRGSSTPTAENITSC